MSTSCLDASHALQMTGKTALVIGGSTGIGNGIAQCFRRQGAVVHVTGTRASADDYTQETGSDLLGLHYTRLDVSRSAEVPNWQPAMPDLDILVMAQGAVVYRRQEFQCETFNHVVKSTCSV